ncbi:MAG: hypothetical protein K5764_09150 [Prevotella sp.]|nr:hypothetical protein [Prevotella sp.]
MEADNTTSLIQGSDSDQKTGGNGATDKAQIFLFFSAFFRGGIFGLLDYFLYLCTIKGTPYKSRLTAQFYVLYDDCQWGGLKCKMI